jgi:hypothetical protein
MKGSSSFLVMMFDQTPWVQCVARRDHPQRAKLYVPVEPLSPGRLPGRRRAVT